MIPKKLKSSLNKKERIGSLPQRTGNNRRKDSPPFRDGDQLREPPSAPSKERNKIALLNRRLSKAVRFKALKRASLTVEAAFILPIFLFVSLALISMLQLYQSYTERFLELQVRAEELGQAAALVDTVIGTNSSFAEDTAIDLIEPVSFQVAFFPWAAVDSRIICRAKVQPWIGISGVGSETAEESTEDDMVYVTPNREVVHTDASCSHLHLQIETVSANTVAGMRNASGKAYHACEKCAAGTSASVVYVGPEGDAYHTDPSCGFKRTVLLVHRSECADLPECSRCGKAA